MTLGSIFSKIGFPNCKFTNMLHQRAKAAISTLNLQEIILPNIHNFVWPGGGGRGGPKHQCMWKITVDDNSDDDVGVDLVYLWAMQLDSIIPG